MASLDTESGEFFEFSRIDHPDLDKLERERFEGQFSYVDNRLICFYGSKPGQSMNLRVDNDLMEIDYDDKVLLEKKSETQNLFRIQKGEKIIFSLVYNRPVINPPLGFYQMVYAAEEEDFDLLLLIYNMCKEPDRKELVFGRVAR
jgi:hypothetical protein